MNRQEGRGKGDIKRKGEERETYRGKEGRGIERERVKTDLRRGKRGRGKQAKGE